MNKILIITSDPHFFARLTDLLAVEHLDVMLARTPVEGLTHFMLHECCLVVFHVSRLGKSEKGILEHIIADGAPVLLLCDNGNEKKPAKAYRMGVVGCVDMPVNELLFSLLVTSFVKWITGAALADRTGRIHIADGLIMDWKFHRAIYRDRMLRLTPKEFDILLLLVRHPFMAFTRMQIYEHIWEHQTAYDVDNTVSCHMLSLRRKLESAGCYGITIETVWGFGYRLIVEKNEEELS